MTREKVGGTLLTALNAAHAEWRPLLALIEEALREARRPVWAESVPALERPAPLGQPLLSGAVVRIAPRSVRQWVHRMLAIAAADGPAEPLLEAVRSGRPDPVSLFGAAISQDVARLDDLAQMGGDDRGVLRVIAPIIAMPMLLACREAWSPLVPAAWADGYCPICGDWPALAEVRGLDGSRHLRCGRCGGDWRTEWLRCPFCGERDHERLGSLVSDGLERQTIEVCERCRHYAKTVTTLDPIPPEHVVLQDLATLVLDVAALERGYRRAATRGCPVAVHAVARPSRLRALLRLRS